MLNAYFVPLKGDIDGHIMFLQTMYDRTDIFQSNYYPGVKPSQHRIGMLNMEVDEKVINQWCYVHFKVCGKHPAIYKINLETMQKELYMDDYIEDFVTEHYNEIMEKLNENM